MLQHDEDCFSNIGPVGACSCGADERTKASGGRDLALLAAQSQMKDELIGELKSQLRSAATMLEWCEGVITPLVHNNVAAEQDLRRLVNKLRREGYI